jgi:hypothetical protein
MDLYPVLLMMPLLFLNGVADVPHAMALFVSVGQAFLAFPYAHFHPLFLPFFCGGLFEQNHLTGQCRRAIMRKIIEKNRIFYQPRGI